MLNFDTDKYIVIPNEFAQQEVIRDLQKMWQNTESWDRYREQSLVLTIGKIKNEEPKQGGMHYIALAKAYYQQQHANYMATGHAVG